jgi:hypothetical protein
MSLNLIGLAAGFGRERGAGPGFANGAGAALRFSTVQVGAQGLSETALSRGIPGSFLEGILRLPIIRRKTIIVVRKTHLDQTQKFRSEKPGANAQRRSRKSF